jgi:hypothetical protein
MSALPRSVARIFDRRVHCPTLGYAIPGAMCTEHQQKAAVGLVGTSAMRTRLTQGCPKCGNYDAQEVRHGNKG